MRSAALIPRVALPRRIALLTAAALLNGCAAAPVSTAPTAAPVVRTSIAPIPTLLPTFTAALALPLPIVSTATIDEPTSAPIVVLPIETRQAIYNEVWRTVHDEYLYPDYHGIDWQGIRASYQRKVEAAPTREAFYDVMRALIDELNDQHSRFVPPHGAQQEDASTSGRETEVGIGALVVPRSGGGFIQLVFPESPAARAGLLPRDRVMSVDGHPYALDDGNLQGETGSRVRLTVETPGGKLRDVVLTRQEVVEHIVPSARRFPDDIGYIAIPTLWVNDMGEQVSGALTDLVASGSLRGLIIDLRGNRGGWGEVLSDILGHFARGQVGVFFGRKTSRPLVVGPPAGPDLRGLPLVVLVDGDTASYAEVLTAVLQHEAKAQVVGVRSAGNTETIYGHNLSDGSRLWLAQEGFRLQNGTNLEGVGIEPDSVVDLDWTSFAEDDDPQILEALRMLGGGPK